MAPLLALVLLIVGNPCYEIVDGQETLVCADPGNRLALGVGGAQSAGAAGLLLTGGLHLRRTRLSRTHEHVAWSTEHLLFNAALFGVGRTDRPMWGELTAYEGLFVRHLDDGYLLVPTSTPTRIPFPFDVAVAVRAGTIERDARGRERLEPVRASVLLDLARDERGLFRFALGPTLSYALQRDASGTLPSLMQPLSGGTLLLRAESDDGHWLAQARVDAGLEFSPRQSATLRVRTVASLERVVLAVNDAPVSIALSLTDTRGTEPGALRAGIALVGSFEL